MRIKTGTQDSPARQPAKVKTEAELKEDRERFQREKRRKEILGRCPPDLVSFAAGVSALVYHPFERARAQLESKGARDFRAFDRGGSQAVAFGVQDHRWLVFRGSESYTESEMFRDWGSDLSFLPWGFPPRHIGFALAWRKIREDVLAWIERGPDAGRVVICGHSLGGALAISAADEIAGHSLAEVEAVVTFGAPRVGTWFWSKRYSGRIAQKGPDGTSMKVLGDVTWRIYNDKDLVTQLPPPLLFMHSGTPISATMLREPAALESPPVSSPLRRSRQPRDIGWFVRTYREKKGAMPLTPVILLIDLLLLITESAPEHFMRHYGNVFPDRPFSDMADPTPAGSPGIGKAVLAVIGLCLLTLTMWWTYQLSPDLTILALTFIAIYMFIEYVSGEAS